MSELASLLIGVLYGALLMLALVVVVAVIGWQIELRGKRHE